MDIDILDIIYYDIDMKKIIFITLFLLFSSSLFFTQDTTNPNDSPLTNAPKDTTNSEFLDNFYVGVDSINTPDTDTESPAMTLLRVLSITGILAFLTWILLKFFFKRNALSLSTAGHSIEVLATVPAGLGSYFVIAKLSSLYYLCSLSNDGLRLLDKISDQEDIDFIELNKTQILPQDIKFVDLLESLPEGQPKKALEFLREKITNLKKK